MCLVKKTGWSPIIFINVFRRITLESLLTLEQEAWKV